MLHVVAECVKGIKMALIEVKDAIKTYIVEDIVKKYMSCIEDIINIPLLLSYFQVVETVGMLPNVLNEILQQSKVEFNYEED